jgi:hypothetical protein
MALAIADEPVIIAKGICLLHHLLYLSTIEP